MSACLLKQGKWQRAIESAEKVCFQESSRAFETDEDQAIALNENNFKALFRKGKALGELGFFEKSYKVLEDLLKKNPAGEGIPLEN